MESDLIRPEALNFQKSSAIGDVVLINPISHVLLAAVGLLLLVLLIVVLGVGEYTRHSLIPGIIEPTAGLAKIYAPQAGLAGEVLVREGDSVKRGQVLIRAFAEHRNGKGADVQDEIDSRAHTRLAALQEELAETMHLNDQEVSSNRDSMAVLIQAKANLETQLRAQNLRTKAAEETLAKFENLRKAGFVSEFQISQHQDDLLDQQLRLDALHKELIAAVGDIQRTGRELQSLPLKRSVSRTQLERNIAAVQGEISQISGEHTWSVVAPADGTVTDVTIIAGQAAVSGTPLMSIMPKLSPLQARLYAPSKSLGFIHVGSEVKIRLDAFPFQKFGTASGHVSRIADAPTPVNEFTSNTTMMPKSTQNQDPLFAIVVDLDNEYVNAYGRREHLRAGMQLDGDVQLDRRKLYEWLLEPLFTVTGR